MLLVALANGTQMNTKQVQRGIFDDQIDLSNYIHIAILHRNLPDVVQLKGKKFKQNHLFGI